MSIVDILNRSKVRCKIYGVKEASKIYWSGWFFVFSTQINSSTQSRPLHFSPLYSHIRNPSWLLADPLTIVDHTEATVFLLHATQGTWGKFSPPIIITLLSCLLVQAIIISWLDYTATTLYPTCINLMSAWVQPECCHLIGLWIYLMSCIYSLIILATIAPSNC